MAGLAYACATIASPDIRRQLVDKENQQYEYIAQEYLHRPDGVLFFEPPPDPQAVWAKPKYPSLVEVANTVAKVLTAPDMQGK